MPSADENKALVRRYFTEVWNKGDMATADEIIAPDYGPSCGKYAWLSGLEAVKLYVSAYREAFPNTRFTILDLVTEGDRVIACWAITGTHSSPATGKCEVATGISVYRIAGGQITEAWAASEDLGSMQRLGLVSEPERHL